MMKVRKISFPQGAGDYYTFEGSTKTTQLLTGAWYDITFDPKSAMLYVKILKDGRNIGIHASKAAHIDFGIDETPVVPTKQTVK